MDSKRNISVWLIRFSCLVFITLVCYGSIRLYYKVTDGFSIENISSDFAYQPQWEVRPLTQIEKTESDVALDQSYHYLGKGCQSYVFLSDDGNYVVKFFKYQRFRLQPWVAYFPPFPGVENYRQDKLTSKWNKLNIFVTSWKIAFENLKDESGLVFVHLNKTTNLNKHLLIYDKMNMKHVLNLDEMEFCVQRRAEPLQQTLIDDKQTGRHVKAQELLTRLLGLILSEYQRGIADNDHALLQNTGVVDNRPIHIDIGQFVLNDKFKDPDYYHQDLFTKTYRLKLWLKDNYPEMEKFLDKQLLQIIGPEYHTMQPKFHAHWEVEAAS